MDNQIYYLPKTSINLCKVKQDSQVEKGVPCKHQISSLFFLFVIKKTKTEILFTYFDKDLCVILIIKYTHTYIKPWAGVEETPPKVQLSQKRFPTSNRNYNNKKALFGLNTTKRASVVFSIFSLS